MQNLSIRQQHCSLSECQRAAAAMRLAAVECGLRCR